MDTKEKLVKWLENMGYDGEVPENITKICNPTTNFIWEQLMQNCKPRQQVNLIKRNLIIHKLNSKSSLRENDEYLKETKLYSLCNQRLCNKINCLKLDLEEKSNKLEDISNKNKIITMNIKHAKLKMQDMEEKLFLLDVKGENLCKEIQNVESQVEMIINLTPIEGNETTDEEKIAETLRKCAEKLEKLVKQVPQTKKHHSNSKARNTTKLSQNTECFYQSFFQKSTVKSKKVFTENSICPSLKVTLFESPQQDLSPVQIVPKKKKESLGLLPESCFQQLENDFLLTPKNSFMDFTLPQYENFEHNLIANMDCGVNSNKITESTFLSTASIDNYEKNFDNKDVEDILRACLYKFNRNTIWRKFESALEDIQSSIKEKLLDLTGKENFKSISKEDIAKLNFIHIKFELETLKLKKEVDSLNEAVDNKIEEILKHYTSKNICDDMMENIKKQLELNITNIGLDSMISTMKKILNDSNKRESESDLRLLEQKITDLKEEMSSKINKIKSFVNTINSFLNRIQQTQESTVCYVKKLHYIINDPSWADLLTKRISSEEIALFKEFPLRYNRKINQSQYERELLDTNISFLYGTDASNPILNELIMSPLHSSEMLFADLLKLSLWLMTLRKAQESFYMEINCNKIDLESLVNQEEFLPRSIDAINKLITSSRSKKIISLENEVKTAVNIWTEMPLKDYILDKRLVDGHSYKFYEKEFNKFFGEL